MEKTILFRVFRLLNFTNRGRQRNREILSILTLEAVRLGLERRLSGQEYWLLAYPGYLGLIPSACTVAHTISNSSLRGSDVLLMQTPGVQEGNRHMQAKHSYIYFKKVVELIIGGCTKAIE